MSFNMYVPKKVLFGAGQLNNPVGGGHDHQCLHQ